MTVSARSGYRHVRKSRVASVGMDEARAVLHRLERIEALERESAPVRSVLAEVHALLAEAEIWVASERDGTDLAEQALLRCCDAVEARGPEKQAVPR
jgi:hypothetical protein